MEPRNTAKLRARAGEILARDGNRLLLIEAQAILLLVFAAYLMLAYATSFFFLMLSDAYVVGVIADLLLPVLFAVFSGAFVLPLGFGLFFMAKRMTEGETCTLADLFYAFRGREAYARALWGTCDVFCIGTVLFLVLTLLDFLMPDLFASPAAVALALLLAFLVFVLASAPFYTRIHDALTDGETVRLTPRRQVCRALRLWGGYSLWLLLGLLTVGLLLIADVLPRMLISREIDCADACPTLDYDIPEDGLYTPSCDK